MTQTREGHTARSDNSMAEGVVAVAANVRADGGVPSYHSPITLCEEIKKDGLDCGGKVTSTGKCFAHSK